MARITLTEAQAAALAEHLGVDAADITDAAQAVNDNTPADPAVDQLSRADIQKLWREGRHREIDAADKAGRVKAEPGTGRDRVLRTARGYTPGDAA